MTRGSGCCASLSQEPSYFIHAKPRSSRSTCSKELTQKSKEQEQKSSESPFTCSQKFQKVLFEMASGLDQPVGVSEGGLGNRGTTNFLQRNRPNAN